MVLAIDQMPAFNPTTLKAKDIPVFQTRATLKDELAAKTIDKAEALSLYEQMAAVRALEEMIYQLRSGAYEPLKGKYEYQGPTHLSIGQEAASVGACSVLNWDDYITSTHRGHGDSMAKGFTAILHMNRAQMEARVAFYQIQLPASLTDDALRDALLKDHVYRCIAELFGKEHGYCKGRGGSMHIADFSCGHLGANAIVGGGTPIALGAAYASRLRQDGKVAVCFVGDGAFSNGITLESLQMATMPQFENGLHGRSFGVPIIYTILNNLYAMTGQTHGELCDVKYLAARAWGFAEDAMQAEVVNGMDVLAVRRSYLKAVQDARAGQGPFLKELITYRYYGHSLSDPRKAYRKKEEEQAWRDIDPLETYGRQLVECGLCSDEDVKAMYQAAFDRNADQAIKAAASPDPDPGALYQYLYTDSSSQSVPSEWKGTVIGPEITAKRDEKGQITYKDAIREALVEEMLRDQRVVMWGEDIADYGGAFFVTAGMVEMFGRDRVFNSSISESAICGTAVGAAMAGLRPVVELMYFDFALQASDQISNQAAKWHYMSGGMRTVPLVIRASAGGGKGYGGQHSQSIESIFCHTPGLKIAVPSNPYDAKGLLKTAIRDDNPVLYVEGQLLYGMKGVVPAEEYTIPFGVAAVKTTGKHVTFVGWSYVVNEAVKAAEQLAKDGIELEVIDARTLVPFDWDTVITSVKKTGKVIIASQAVKIGSFTAEVADQITSRAFDYLDAPPVRLGAAGSISPQAKGMEKAYLVWAEDIVREAKKLVGRKV